MSISIPGLRRVPGKMRRRSYELWVETGSVKAVRDRLTAEGILNSNGRPYAESQISTQAYVYLLENFSQKNLIEDFQKDRERLGMPLMSQIEFEEFLVLKAVRIWATKNHVSRFWDWIDNHGFEKYSYLWEDDNISPRPDYRSRRPVAP